MTDITSTLADAWFHTLDPVLVRLWGGVVVRYYGLAYMVGFVIAAAMLKALARRGASPIPAHRVLDAMTWLVAGTIVGGRAGYVLVYQPSLLTTLTPGFPFWGALAVHQGGLASHGGMVGLILACWRIGRGFGEDDGSRSGRAPTLRVTDAVCMVAMPGVFLGRVANFINGELLGKIVAAPGSPAPWWSVRFPRELDGWIAPGTRQRLSHAPELSPDQRAALDRLVEGVRLPEEPWASALAQIIANPGRYRAQLEPLLSARHPSQLYQALAEGVVLLVVVWAIARLPRRAGLITAWWFIVYGALRITTEFWRLPDAQFGDAGRIYGLSRGQWLSAGMVGFGAGLLGVVLARGGARVGGWLRPAGAARATGSV
ncbi:MAG: prolipoprotein diacylglyceryl transferase [Isosphaera sp.]|nr:prolipoprotein diacylglyceryl transferase [Isosphaera sp.]